MSHRPKTTGFRNRSIANAENDYPVGRLSGNYVRPRAAGLVKRYAPDRRLCLFLDPGLDGAIRIEATTDKAAASSKEGLQLVIRSNINHVCVAEFYGTPEQRVLDGRQPRIERIPVKVGRIDDVLVAQPGLDDRGSGLDVSRTDFNPQRGRRAVPSNNASRRDASDRACRPRSAGRSGCCRRPPRAAHFQAWPTRHRPRHHPPGAGAPD